MGKQLFIGIDVGSSGVRVEVYDVEGNLISAGKAGISKQTVEEWIKAIDEAMPTVVKNCTDCEKHVSVDSTSGTFIAIDKFGKPLHGPVMYYEKRGDVFEEVKSLEAVNELSKRGVSVDASSPFVKMLFMKKSLGNVYGNVYKFVPATTWLLYSLCYDEGEPWEDVKTDYTNALKFGLDILSKPPKWFEPLYNSIGIEIDKLPGLAPSGEFICRAKSGIAQKMGLHGASVYQGMTDGNAAALAGGVLEKGDVNIYTGSTTVPKISVDRIVMHPAIYYHIHPLDGYLAGSATGFTGAYLSWISEKVFGLSVGEAFRYIEAVEAGTEYLFFPYGDRGPFYDPSLAPAFINFVMYDQSRDVVIGRILRSVVLGITMLENYYIDLFQKLFNVNIGEVNLTGGAVRSKLWNRIRASVYERRVVVHGDLIGIGTIIPILYRNKIYTNVNEIKQRFLKPVEIVDPDAELTKIYKRFKESFEKKWLKLQELYKT